MSNLTDFAKRELEMIGSQDEPMQQAINKCIMDIVELFDSQGHSGFSAGYVIPKVNRLLNFKPLHALTGEDDEWRDPYGGSDCKQNKRYGAVFKKNDGYCYNIEGKIFTDNAGETWYTCKESSVPVEFPYIVPEHPIAAYRYFNVYDGQTVRAPEHITWTKVNQLQYGEYFIEGEINYSDKMVDWVLRDGKMERA